MTQFPRLLVLQLVVFAPLAAQAADDPRVTRLEQDVRALQRDMQSLSRQIQQMQFQTTRPGTDGRTQPPPAPVDTGTGWLDAAKWRRLRTGMSELDVIGTLGPPTSMREEKGTRELLYAMEIGTSAFLAGSVVLRDRVVVEVRIPTLK